MFLIDTIPFLFASSFNLVNMLLPTNLLQDEKLTHDVGEVGDLSPEVAPRGV